MRGKFVAWIMAPLKSVLYRCSGNFERVSVIHLSSHKLRRSPSRNEEREGREIDGRRGKGEGGYLFASSSGGGMHVPWDKTR